MPERIAFHIGDLFSIAVHNAAVFTDIGQHGYFFMDPAVLVPLQRNFQCAKSFGQRNYTFIIEKLPPESGNALCVDRLL